MTGTALTSTWVLVAECGSLLLADHPPSTMARPTCSTIGLGLCCGAGQVLSHNPSQKRAVQSGACGSVPGCLEGQVFVRQQLPLDTFPHRILPVLHPPPTTRCGGLFSLRPALGASSFIKKNTDQEMPTSPCRWAGPQTHGGHSGTDTENDSAATSHRGQMFKHRFIANPRGGRAASCPRASRELGGPSAAASSAERKQAGAATPGQRGAGVTHHM